MSVYNQGGPSATSLNFIGFDDAAKNSTSPLIYDQVYIQFDQPATAGRSTPSQGSCQVSRAT